MQFSKTRCLITVAEIILYLGDILTDLVLAWQYFRDGHLAWFSLTLSFVLSGSLCTQIFSYAWYNDDFAASSSAQQTTRAKFLVLHLLQLGLFTRYYQFLKKAVQAQCSNPNDERDLKRELFDQLTDLSMLRLFETFLESSPQLVLQLYIMFGHNHRSTLQYICIAGSFLNISWATVKYRRCFRRSVPWLNEMPSGVPTVVYLLYKLCTITSRVLSLSLLLVLSVYSALALAFLWLVAMIWAHVLQTHFCTSKHLEKLYRGIVGVILIFTFFNVKGQNTKVPMTIYYTVYGLQNLLIPLLLFLFKPAAEIADYFGPTLIVIVVSLGFGFLFLFLFYTFFHTRNGGQGVADEVDGLENDLENTERMKEFLQL